MDATVPQNDRELLLSINSEIKELRAEIGKFNLIIKDIDERKISKLEAKIEQLEYWKQQISGGWKIFLMIWAIVSAIIIAWVKSKI